MDELSEGEWTAVETVLDRLPTPVRMSGNTISQRPFLRTMRTRRPPPVLEDLDVSSDDIDAMHEQLENCRERRRETKSREEPPLTDDEWWSRERSRIMKRYGTLLHCLAFGLLVGFMMGVWMCLQ